jgi:hypothetical protein
MLGGRDWLRQKLSGFTVKRHNFLKNSAPRIFDAPAAIHL